MLSTSYPSRGGTVTFLNRAFGPARFAGGLNVLLWVSYIVMLALYAQAFGAYAASFLPLSAQGLWKHLFLTAALVALAALNVAGAATVTRAERVVVAIKIAILLVFVAVGLTGISTTRLAPAHWNAPVSLIAGGMIIFLAYEGFELIANAAEDVTDPGRTLTRAYYICVLFVITLYVLIAIVSVGSLPIPELVNARDYALAEAARPTLGQTGFAIIAVAAMLSTASAINATLYGSARLTYMIAKSGQLPTELERPIWNQPLEGLLITAGSTIILANLMDLTNISTMGSAGFLMIFAAVNLAEARTAADRGSAPWISTLAAITCVAALLALITDSSPAAVLVLLVMVAASFGIEFVFKGFATRRRGGSEPQT